MPIYAYRCEACGHAKDVLQKFSDPLLSTCPSCGAEAFKKQVTAAGFQLKGSGWYVTDFRGDSKAPKAPAEGVVAKTDGGTTEAAKGESTQAESGKGGGKADAAKSPSSKSETAAAPAAPAPAPAAGSGSGGAGSASGGQ